MEINFYPPEKQASGNFNFGEILEKKPIGFPQDNGQLRPYSNLFYWAHAWTPDKKSTIGLHPHQGFEICSFILEGSINHFDTKQNKWIPLSEGDVQIIRSGNGISHAEEIDDKSEIFQIWFDPDLSKSLQKEASYDDYSSDDFKVIELDDKTKKDIEFSLVGTAAGYYLGGIPGAIIGGKDDTATAKKRIMRESGISVVDSPADIGKTVKQILN